MSNSKFTPRTFRPDTTCLDFVNTLDWRNSDHPKELLKSYAVLVKWALRKKIVDEKTAERLIARAEVDPESAQIALNNARELREAICQLFVDHIFGRPVNDEALEIVNRVLSKSIPRLEIHPGDNPGFRWVWLGSSETQDCMLVYLARSAAELLSSDWLGRVGQCANKECGWLFLDESRNHNRRWCDMSACGNRAKARRHYQKVKNSARQ